MELVCPGHLGLAQWHVGAWIALVQDVLHLSGGLLARGRRLLLIVELFLTESVLHSSLNVGVLNFSELVHNGIHILEGVLDLNAGFGAGKNDFPARKYKQHDFWFFHLEDKTRKNFWLVVAPRHFRVFKLQTLKTDAEAYIDRRDDILDLKVSHVNCLHHGTAFGWPGLRLAFLGPAIKDF